MRTPNQARIRLHKRRLDLGHTMISLAKAVGHPRESVSRAVNQGQHPRVLRKVKEVLGVG